MSAIDRVMRAYVSKHDLNPSQAAFLRAELSKFIDELMAACAHEISGYEGARNEQ